MLGGRVYRRLTAAPKWGPRSSELSKSMATSPDQPEQEERGWSKSTQVRWFLMTAGLFASAAWNLFRALANEKVRDNRESRLNLKALQGSEIHNLCSTDQSLEFRRVVCKGAYEEKSSILVKKKYLKTKSGEWKNGYNLLTPLIPIPGDPQSIQSPILVNRGWVPLSWGDNKPSQVLESNPSSPSRTSIRGQEEAVQFVGVISKGEKPNKVWRRNNPSNSKWCTVDVPSLATACGLPETTLHVVEIDLSREMNTRKPAPFASLRGQVKGIYLSQLEYERYSRLGFVYGCASMALGLKKMNGKP